MRWSIAGSGQAGWPHALMGCGSVAAAARLAPCPTEAGGRRSLRCAAPLPVQPRPALPRPAPPRPAPPRPALQRPALPRPALPRPALPRLGAVGRCVDASRELEEVSLPEGRTMRRSAEAAPGCLCSAAHHVRPRPPFPRFPCPCVPASLPIRPRLLPCPCFPTSFLALLPHLFPIPPASPPPLHPSPSPAHGLLAGDAADVSAICTDLCKGEGLKPRHNLDSHFHRVRVKSEDELQTSASPGQA
eukprot:363106-Chlamydomonas_euryale.AAC.2